MIFSIKMNRKKLGDKRTLKNKLCAFEPPPPPPPHPHSHFTGWKLAQLSIILKSNIENRNKECIALVQGSSLIK